MTVRTKKHSALYYRFHHKNGKLDGMSIFVASTIVIVFGLLMLTLTTVDFSDKNMDPNTSQSTTTTVPADPWHDTSIMNLVYQCDANNNTLYAYRGSVWLQLVPGDPRCTQTKN